MKWNGDIDFLDYIGYIEFKLVKYDLKLHLKSILLLVSQPLGISTFNRTSNSLWQSNHGFSFEYHSCQTEWGSKFETKLLSSSVRALCLTLERCSTWKQAWIPILFIMQSRTIRIYTANQVIPRICFHRALTYEELTAAKKNPASLTEIKEAENAVTWEGDTSASFTD